MARHEQLDIYIFCPGMSFQGDTLSSDKSLGGSETAALSLGRELGALGNKVTVFSNCEKPGVYDDVLYRPLAEWQICSTANPHDITIVQRTPGIFASRLASKATILWQHDLALRRQQQQVCGSLWNIDRIATVSKFHTNQYQEVYGLPDEVFFTSRNGIDPFLFDIDRPRRDYKKLIYSARPERGLDVLLHHVFPELLKRDPEFRLFICGYDNTVPEMAAFYDGLKRKAAEYGDHCVWLGALSKKQLYWHYLSAGCYVYPTPSPAAPNFREVSCITAMECAAAGLPFVSSRIGALHETCMRTGGAYALVEVEKDSIVDLPDSIYSTSKYITAFCDEVMKQREHAGFRLDSEQLVSISWASVAEEWQAEIEKVIAGKNQSKQRRALHFIRHSDIVAAKVALEGCDDIESNRIRSHIDTKWGALLGSKEDLQRQNERIGKTHTDCFAQSRQEMRYTHMVKWTKDHPDIRRILDFGCAHGAYACNLVNEVDVHVLGVDVDSNGIALAKKWAADPERVKNPERLMFLQGDADIDLGKDRFDALFAMEVLEHVQEPWDAINKLERWIKPDGAVLITVPFGPWEYASYETYEYRQHVREFDLHDLRDMFGNKQNLSISTMPYGVAKETMEPIGWYVVEYRVDPERQCNAIDMDRKQRLQAPRQSVSACIIAGPDSEQTLHWCLKSLKHLADEIIIGDCGMNNEAKRIASQYQGYGVQLKIIPTSDPKKKGFETPRNELLDHAVMDWILWIDTDEKLLGVENAIKYLRSNMFDGYSIKQHHFSVDADFQPDMPVRMFRRIGNDGRPLRFFGMIHEHPEKALNEGPGHVILIGDVAIPHVGYLHELIRRDRFARNRPLLDADKKKYPNRKLQKHFYMRDLMLEAKYILEQNGGIANDDVKQRCSQVVDLYREHFLGQPGFLNSDSLGYYSEANKILGNKGFEIAYQFAADKMAAKPNGTKTVRFASMEDMEKELTAQMRRAAEPFITEYY